MNTNVRRLLHIIILIMSLVLLIGGIITGKHGATVAGIIIAAVNIQGLINLNKKISGNRTNS